MEFFMLLFWNYPIVLRPAVYIFSIYVGSVIDDNAFFSQVEIKYK